MSEETEYMIHVELGIVMERWGDSSHCILVF